MCGTFILHFINYYSGMAPFWVGLEIAAVIVGVINVFVAMIRRFIFSGKDVRTGIVAMIFLLFGLALISGIRWVLSKNFSQN